MYLLNFLKGERLVEEGKILGTNRLQKFFFFDDFVADADELWS